MATNGNKSEPLPAFGAVLGTASKMKHEMNEGKPTSHNWVKLCIVMDRDVLDSLDKKLEAENAKNARFNKISRSAYIERLVLNALDVTGDL